MEIKNEKKVFTLKYGSTKTVGKPRASKKKIRRDAKRAQKNAKWEQEKLLKSGLITQEDIDNMEQSHDMVDNIADE